ncbi:MAG: GNAT family N-acetyltransferase [Candidatus Fimimonas sp.]
MHTIYKTGKQFLDDCGEILQKNLMETSFFVIDAKLMEVCRGNDFIVKVAQDNKILLMLHFGEYPAVLFGDVEPCAEMAKLVVEHGYSFDAINCEPTLGEAFFAEYQKLQGGTHKVKLDMQIMRCAKTEECNTSGVRWATESDAPQIAKLLVAFSKEALGDDLTEQDALQRVLARLDCYAVIEQDGQIAAVASAGVATEGLARVFNVFTLPKFRNKGFSKKIVTFLTDYLLNKGNEVMLYVDTHNPVSNKLYRSVGYDYLCAQCMMVYQK